ncbi:MAG: PorV/PorQ family protein [Bacteroidota bacterium]|nr:PorV/PorQ family protein [Bacteroidota bacterium]
MPNKIGRIVSIVFVIKATFIAYGQVSTPKYSNEFLQIGIGARALGMANAQVAVTNDVSSVYWNPAGVVKIDSKYQLAAMHTEYFAGIAKYDYAGFAYKLDSISTIAISAIRFGIDNIPDTRYLIDNNGAVNYSQVRMFSVSDQAFLASYSRKINHIEGLSIGVNFKVIYRDVGIFGNAWGFGLDGGLQYQRKKWLMGAILRDVAGTWNIWSFNTDELKDTYLKTGNDLPENSTEVTLPSLVLAVARTFTVLKKVNIVPTLDFQFTFDGKRNVLVKSQVTSIDPRFGLEISYAQIVFLRGGVWNMQQVTGLDKKKYWILQPNFGIGVKYKKFCVDYALSNIGNGGEVLYSHVFSLKLGIK